MRAPPRGMTMKDSVLPIFLSVDDPFVLELARSSCTNKMALEQAEKMGKTVVCAIQMPSIGEYVLLFPRGAFGELVDMDKSVLWALKSAMEKLKSAYMDMEEDEAAQKEVKDITKRLQDLMSRLDKKGWSE